jgi:arylsulfatase A-like enzyme
MHSYKTILLTSLMFAALPAWAQSPTQSKPNVVLIITDDAGYGDFSSYGAKDVKTPSIDSLAKDGTKFTDFYAAPTCTPTRAALMTGRYQQRVQIERPFNPTGATVGALIANGRSLPQLIKNNGYVTGLVGKWHLGWTPQSSPLAHGFDSFFGHKGGFIDFYQHTNQLGQPDLYENETPVKVEGYMTDLITDRSVKFIENNAKQPFFLEVMYNGPHWPFQPPDKPSVAPNNARFEQPTDATPTHRADYVKMLERVDQGVGEILATLKRLGVDKNTLVIFSNDNGGEWMSNGGPLHHRKDTLWEGGIRVPTIMRFPGRVPAGKVSSQVGMTMDLTATILAVTNSPVPSDARLEGINLLPLVAKGAKATERTLFWRIDSPTRKQRAVRQGDWKLLIDGDDLMVYNLAKDIGERNDLVRTLQGQEAARRLRPLIAAWEKDVDGESGKVTPAEAPGPANPVAVN